MKSFKNSNKLNFDIAEVAVSNKVSIKAISPSITNYTNNLNIVHNSQNPNQLPSTTTNNISNKTNLTGEDEIRKAQNLAMQLGSNFYLGVWYYFPFSICRPIFSSYLP